MLVTTTSVLDGMPVARYLGVVTGETIMGVNIFKDLAASWRNMVGGRAQGYEEEIRKAKDIAMQEMLQRAQELGANAVIGVAFDYQTIGGDGSNMMMVGVSGTAVQV